MPSFRSRPLRRELTGFTTDRLALTLGSWPEPALLESGSGFGDAGRWSIYTAHPRLVFEALDAEWVLLGTTGTLQSGQGDILAALGVVLSQFGLANPSEVPAVDTSPFQGGAIGYFGYDLAPQLERLPRKAAHDSRFPDVRFALYDTAVVYDHQEGRAFLEAHDLFDEGPKAVERRANHWQAALGWPVPKRALSRCDRLKSNFTKKAYLAAAHRALDYIAAGDVFQINLSQRFTAHGEIDPLHLYLRLRTESPAPFAAFLQWDDLAVVSASPEWFYQTRGDRIITRPIKGTRRAARLPLTTPVSRPNSLPARKTAPN